jgi:hypothetical protein
MTVMMVQRINVLEYAAANAVVVTKNIIALISATLGCPARSFPEEIWEIGKRFVSSTSGLDLNAP